MSEETFNQITNICHAIIGLSLAAMFVAFIFGGLAILAFGIFDMWRHGK